jgi:preprotein translocase subunit SecG
MSDRSVYSGTVARVADLKGTPSVATALSVVIAVLSLTLIGCVLLHRGSGGGLSDVFGGGSTAASGSAHANRNLTRMTVAIAVLWGVSTVALAVLAR